MTATAERPGVGMNAEEWAGVISAVGAVAVALWKGVPAVIKAIGQAIRDRDKEIQKVKDEAAKLVETERKAAHERAITDLNQATTELRETRCELEESRTAEQDCKVTLARVLAWVVHLESALTAAKIPFVPFNEGGRADSDEVHPNPKRKRGQS